MLAWVGIALKKSQAGEVSGAAEVVDVSEILGAKLIFNDGPPRELFDSPVTAEACFSPAAYSFRHVHPRQDESFHVLSGRLSLLLDNQWHELGPGQSLTIPKGKVHAFRNSTNEIAKAMNAHDPGLRFQEYLDRLQTLIQQGKVTKRSGLRNGIYMSLLARQFSNEVIPVEPPYWFVKLVARIGRLSGHKL